MPSFLHRSVAALAAAFLVPSLTLVACSSDDAEEKATGSSSAVPALPMPITSSLLTVPPTQQASKDTGVPSPAGVQDKSEESGALGPDADGAADGNAGADAQGKETAPPGSAPNAPAPGSDEEQITTLVTDMYQQETWSDFVNYMPAHSCQALVAQNGLQDPVELNDTPLEQMPNFDKSQTGIEDVKDIQVDGNRATATVVSKSQGEVSSTQVVFAKENNQWTFCK